MSVPMRWAEEALPESPYAPSGPQLRKRPGRRRARRLLRGTLLALSAGLCLSLLALAVIGAGSLLRTWGEKETLSLLPAETAGRQILLKATSAERKLGFVTVTGSVLSREARRLPQVEAIVELVDGKQTTLRMESALLAGVLSPQGDSVPFRVALPDDSRAVSYRIRFRQLTGAFLN